MRTRIALLVLLTVAAAGCGKSGSSTTQPGGSLLIAVDGPFSQSPYIGRTIANGVQLAADQLNTRGLLVGKRGYRLKVVRYDNGLSAVKAVADTRAAIRRDAVAIVTDGTGVDATWQIAGREHVPIGIVYQGGQRLVDPAKRPNVFRIAPTDHGLAFRLAEYLVPKRLKIALLTDDTAYGQEGKPALAKAFATTPKAIAARITLPATAGDLAPQILQAQRAHATALLVWAEPPVLAKAIAAARSSGWRVPVYTTPAGADPLIRQQLADHPAWIDGLTFASGRITAELGAAPWGAFAAAYTSAYGPEYVGVRFQGRRVTQPPDYAMYAYDFVNVLAAAVQKARSVDTQKILAAMNQVSTRGANGDERGFNENSHEGVVDDDVYFARFNGMTFRPVKDDPLSATLPTISQTQ